MNAPLVGQPIERIEDLRLLRGAGCFTDDIAAPDALAAVILRSPLAHGLITRLDTEAAQKLPGVVSIITARTIGMPVPTIPLRLAPLAELVPYEQPVIAQDRVRYVGEPIAMVVATSAAIAEDALDLIELEIAPLPAIVTNDDAAAAAALLFPDSGSNLCITYTARLGDAAQEFPGAIIVEDDFSTQRHTAATMETRGLLARWDTARGHLTVHGAAKAPWAGRRMLARQLGLDEFSIDMIAVDVGGGFGMRGEFYPEDFLIPFAARHLDRPVKWIEDRREHLLSANHAREFDAHLQLILSPAGDILAVRGRARCNLGAYMRANASIAPRNVAQFFSGPYRIPNIAIDTDVFLTNKTPTGTYRGPGRFETDFFRERLLDLAAERLGMDRVVLRRRNLITSAQMPHPIATVSAPVKAEELDSGDYAETLDRCLGAIGWDRLQPLRGQRINGRHHGVAVGCFIEGGAAGPSEHARLELGADGMVDVFVGSSMVGQGLETVLLQISADALGLPMERLRIFHGSTTYLRIGFGSFHSRSTVMGGTAILNAATTLKEAIRAAAGRRLNCAPDEVLLGAGTASNPSGAIVSWAELAAEVPAAPGQFDNHTHTYAYGAHAAHVGVDIATGHVEIFDYVAVEDVGRVINPLTLRGQVLGALVQGLGGVFLEHLAYDADGQLTTGSFADYLLPTTTDFQKLRSITQGRHPARITPLGAKGAGEGGAIPAGGVIANAIADALGGARTNHLPLSPDQVWRLAEPLRA